MPMDGQRTVGELVGDGGSRLGRRGHESRSSTCSGQLTVEREAIDSIARRRPQLPAPRRAALTMLGIGSPEASGGKWSAVATGSPASRGIAARPAAGSRRGPGVAKRIPVADASPVPLDPGQRSAEGPVVVNRARSAPARRGCSFAAVKRWLHSISLSRPSRAIALELDVGEAPDPDAWRNRRPSLATSGFQSVRVVAPAPNPGGN